MQTAIWRPQSLCECRLQITAEFLPGAVRDGVSYQHPLHIRAEGPQGEICGTTIQDIQIKAVCGLHAKHQEQMPDLSMFFDIRRRIKVFGTDIGWRWIPCHGNMDKQTRMLASEFNVDPEDLTIEEIPGQVPEQHRGYLFYPLKQETPAARLYSLLSMHRGDVESMDCGCSSFQHRDENNHTENPHATFTYLWHPRYSQQCWEHRGDDVQMTRAKADRERLTLAHFVISTDLLRFGAEGIAYGIERRLNTFEVIAA